MYDALPKREKTFLIDMIGEETGEVYKGEFTIMCILDMGGKHAEELEKTRLMADFANPSNGLLGISITLAKLRARIIDGPKWWENSNGGSTIMDEDVIGHLYDECLRLEKEWRENLKKKAEEAQAGNLKTETK